MQEAAIANGLIRINGERKAREYVVRNGDFLAHVVHRHEPPVHLPSPLSARVESEQRGAEAAEYSAPSTQKDPVVVFDGDDVVVVNKPSSVPVHPSGAYLHNSMTMLLQSEFGQPELFPVHRLDRLTSGLLLLAKSPEKARELCEDIASGAVQKHYVARVLGEFPRVCAPAANGDSPDQWTRRFHASRAGDDEEATALAEVSRKELAGEMYWSLSAPIACVSSADHLQGVKRDGKAAETLMRTLSFDGTHSIVECLPVTGRTHQIRVHLLLLGFPIANDPQYGPESVSVRVSTEQEEEEADQNGAVDSAQLDLERSLTSDRDTADDDAAQCAAICSTCRDGDQAVFSLVQRECFTLWLHSFKYTSAKWAYEVPLPQWAQAGVN